MRLIGYEYFKVGQSTGQFTGVLNWTKLGVFQVRFGDVKLVL